MSIDCIILYNAIVKLKITLRAPSVFYIETEFTPISYGGI